MFKTGESAYEARRELWEQRRAREAQMKEAQRQEGQGRVAPLAVVPELGWTSAACWLLMC